MTYISLVIPIPISPLAGRARRETHRNWKTDKNLDLLHCTTADTVPKGMLFFLAMFRSYEQKVTQSGHLAIPPLLVGIVLL
jgi:hypothetical protein